MGLRCCMLLNRTVTHSTGTASFKKFVRYRRTGKSTRYGNGIRRKRILFGVDKDTQHAHHSFIASHNEQHHE